MCENIIKECDITKEDIAKIFTDPNYIKKLDFSGHCVISTDSTKYLHDVKLSNRDE